MATWEMEATSVIQQGPKDEAPIEIEGISQKYHRNGVMLTPDSSTPG